MSVASCSGFLIFRSICRTAIRAHREFQQLRPVRRNSGRERSLPAPRLSKFCKNLLQAIQWFSHGIFVLRPHFLLHLAVEFGSRPLPNGQLGGKLGLDLQGCRGLLFCGERGTKKIVVRFS